MLPDRIVSRSSRRRPALTRALIPVLAAAALSAPTAQVALASPAVTGGNPALVWGPCPDVTQPSLGLECAALPVPLDYSRPHAEKISVAVSRLPSTRPEKRRGVLVLNPGGQFDSELDQALRLVSLGLPAAVRESYDLVAFDPRGIGRSTPVTCDLRPGQDLNVPASPYAATTADLLRQWSRLRIIAGQCAHSATAGLLPHMSTANVARDLDRIRAALGERRVSYLGYSYGTYLGAVYATLFPDRTDRVVLDSVVGSGGIDYTWSRRLGEGVQDTFPDFAAWAAARDDTYHLGATPDLVQAKYHALAQRLDRRPLGHVTGAEFRYSTFGSLFAAAAYPSLAESWHQIDQGIVPGAPRPQADFSGFMHLACNSGQWPKDFDTYRRTLERDRARFPMFGGSGAGPWLCPFRPRPVEAPVRISDRGPSTVLMVSNLRDPGTPYVGAVETRRALGQRARLVSVDDSGHLVYLYHGNRCANDLVTRFLVTGERPATDQRC
ncbi:pimeloyl-ACP methyl ester carboxylesterase [Actinokineospora baliensis]|uniref:alpha/beta hydrolase n=1 Tax=Actinokineospora baliensis TaxID=547056 RepID=UPI00195A379F|nr:alpha/beta hydrolase [Actinokineospora baliensis]MBM7774561.1 pimeloyl-ACP methyl ester carboxylesterase [Actinokineospora baliensis]